MIPIRTVRVFSGLFLTCLTSPLTVEQILSYNWNVFDYRGYGFCIFYSIGDVGCFLHLPVLSNGNYEFKMMPDIFDEFLLTQFEFEFLKLKTNV